MTHEPPPIPFDLVALARAIDARCPELVPVGPLQVDSTEGWSSVALRSPAGGGEGYAVLVARRSEHPEWERAARLLPLLQGRLPSPVPSDVTLLHPADDLVWPVLLYPRLPGTPLTSESAAAGIASEITNAIGAFLAALHALPAEEFTNVGIPTSEPRYTWIRRHADGAMPVLRQHLPPAEIARLEAWLNSFFDDPRMRISPPRLRHGDPWPGNVLTDGTKVTGIIDWEDVALGDPALDLAGQFEANGTFFAAVLDGYGAAGGEYNAEVEYRTRRWWEANCFQWVTWAIRPGNESELPNAIETVRTNPILTGWL